MSVAENLSAVWEQHWRRAPELVTLGDIATGERISARDVLVRSYQIAQRLGEAGVTAGDRVMVALPHSVDFALIFIALVRMGATAVVVNPNSTPAELAHYNETTRPTLVLDGRFPGVTSTSDAISGPEVASEIALAPGNRSEDVAVICFTSGTTGPPKAVPLTHRNLLAGTRALGQAWRWTPDDVLLSALPMFHVHGLVVALCGSLTAGAAIAIQQRFDAERLCRAAATWDATMLFGVPTMWWRIARAESVDQLRNLRLAVSGSAPLDPGLSQELADHIGQVPVERYGMSETLILTSNPIDGPRKPGSVGLPLPGVELRLNDEAVVEVRAESIFDGYLGVDEDRFTADGWFRTGDVGRMDDDGFLYLEGRQSETIITGGHNVLPLEIETLLLAQPGVSEAAVVGKPDPQWGQVVTAFVVADSEGLDLDRLAAACEESLSDFKRPREWRVVDSLPRNSMGKIVRSDLYGL